MDMLGEILQAVGIKASRADQPPRDAGGSRARPDSAHIGADTQALLSAMAQLARGEPAADSARGEQIGLLRAQVRRDELPLDSMRTAIAMLEEEGGL